MTRITRTLGATLTTAGLLAAGSIAGAIPAQAATVTSYVIASTTSSGCNSALQGDIHDLKSQGIYKRHTPCTNTGAASYPWRAQVWYYAS